MLRSTEKKKKSPPKVKQFVRNYGLQETTLGSINYNFNGTGTRRFNFEDSILS